MNLIFLFISFFLCCALQFFFFFLTKVRLEQMTTANSAIQLPHSVVISIEETLKHLGPVSSERCIYRVPVSIRKVNEEAYTPRIVSVGPLHHGRKRVGSHGTTEISVPSIFSHPG